MTKPSRAVLEPTIVLMFATILLSATGQRAASAQSNIELSKAHYAAAAAYYKQGRYREAIKEFEASYKLSNKPALLYNIAVCWERLGNLRKAIDFRKQYLAGMPDAPDKAQVLLQIRSLEARLAATAIRLEGRIPQEAQVLLDGKVVHPDKTGKIPALPGNHEILIQQDGRELFRVAVALAQGQQLRVPVRIRNKSTETAPQPPPSQTGSHSYLPVWITLGAAGAILVAATGLGTAALTTADSANDALDKGYLSTYDSRKAKAKKLALAADISFALAGGLAATSLVLFLVERYRKPGRSKRALFIPTVGPKSAGVAAVWDF